MNTSDKAGTIYAHEKKRRLFFGASPLYFFVLRYMISCISRAVLSSYYRFCRSKTAGSFRIFTKYETINSAAALSQAIGLAAQTPT